MGKEVIHIDTNDVKSMVNEAYNKLTRHWVDNSMIMFRYDYRIIETGNGAKGRIYYLTNSIKYAKSLRGIHNDRKCSVTAFKVDLDTINIIDFNEAVEMIGDLDRTNTDEFYRRLYFELPPEYNTLFLELKDGAYEYIMIRFNEIHAELIDYLEDFDEADIFENLSIIEDTDDCKVCARYRFKEIGYLKYFDFKNLESFVQRPSITDRNYTKKVLSKIISNPEKQIIYLFSTYVQPDCRYNGIFKLMLEYLLKNHPDDIMIVNADNWDFGQSRSGQGLDSEAYFMKHGFKQTDVDGWLIRTN